MNHKCLIFIVCLILFSANAFAQSGGSFEITQSVVASNGGQFAVGGAFTLDGAIGQPAAGNALVGQPFAVTSGFWNFAPLAPTAAMVTVSGRVRNAEGTGIPMAIIIVQNLSGTFRSTRTNSFGYYTFTDLEVGQTYIFSVQNKESIFAPQVVHILDNLVNFDFISL